MNASKIIATYEYYTRAGGQFAPSPCVSVCLMEPASQLCGGCFRTLDEIAAWSCMDEEGKREVWQRLVQRAAASEPIVGQPTGQVRTQLRTPIGPGT
jgi:uncharacterized protein